MTSHDCVIWQARGGHSASSFPSENLTEAVCITGTLRSFRARPAFFVKWAFNALREARWWYPAGHEAAMSSKNQGPALLSGSPDSLLTDKGKRGEGANRTQPGTSHDLLVPLAVLVPTQCAASMQGAETGGAHKAEPQLKMSLLWEPSLSFPPTETAVGSPSDAPRQCLYGHCLFVQLSLQLDSEFLEARNFRSVGHVHMGFMWGTCRHNSQRPKLPCR